MRKRKWIKNEKLLELLELAKYTAQRFLDMLIFPPRSFKEVVYPDYYELSIAREKKIWNKNFEKLIRYLKRRRYLVEQKVKDKQKCFMTTKGISKFLEIQIKTKIKKKKELKDEYLVLIFDIPEKNKKQRDILRARLKLLGFKKLQKSVWVSPIDCLKEIGLLVKLYRIEKYVRFIIARNVKI
ncbi:hypothetical protein J7K86_00495 [bacterium]|nr:hypothetical protein [bacterium]